MSTCYQFVKVGRIIKGNQIKYYYWKENEEKEDDAWRNDENGPTEQENEVKEDDTGENDDDTLLDSV